MKVDRCFHLFFPVCGSEIFRVLGEIKRILQLIGWVFLDNILAFKV